MPEMQHVTTNAESCSRFYDIINDIACAMPYIHGAIQFGNNLRQSSSPQCSKICEASGLGLFDSCKYGREPSLGE